MTIVELRQALQNIVDRNDADAEQTHIEADELLLDFVDDDEVRRLHKDCAPYCA